jgi:hypothetical protein
MIMVEQVFAQAMLLSGEICAQQEPMLKVLCQSAVNSLTARLRPGLRPADCKADFIAAASLYALAALSELDEIGNLDRMQVGDVTMVRSSRSPAAACLRSQANLMMGPYLQDRFSFRGV